jgi:hypothetical protein
MCAGAQADDLSPLATARQAVSTLPIAFLVAHRRPAGTRRSRKHLASFHRPPAPPSLSCGSSRPTSASRRRSPRPPVPRAAPFAAQRLVMTIACRLPPLDTSASLPRRDPATPHRAAPIHVLSPPHTQADAALAPEIVGRGKIKFSPRAARLHAHFPRCGIAANDPPPNAARARQSNRRLQCFLPKIFRHRPCTSRSSPA